MALKIKYCQILNYLPLENNPHVLIVKTLHCEGAPPPPRPPAVFLNGRAQALKTVPQNHLECLCFEQ